MKRTVKFALLACLIMITSVFMFTSCNNNCKHDDPSQIENIGAVAPTCRETGLTAGLLCKLCKTMVVPQRIVETIECLESDWIIDKEATKTENGVKHTECIMCDKRMREEIIHAGVSNGLKYRVNSDNESCAITGIGSCNDLDIVIPTVIDGYMVTSIESNAFQHCTSLTNIVIPDSVTSIGDFAFASCDNLTSVTIPEGVGSISEYMFTSCDNLTSITIGGSVTHIGKMALSGCKSLESITFKGTVEQWKTVSKGTNWNLNAGEYTIYCMDGQIEKIKTYCEGDIFPNVSIPVYDGDGEYSEMFDPKADKSTVTVIYFWGVWSPQCIKELTCFDQIASHFSHIVDVVAIHSFDQMDESDEYIDEHYSESKIRFGVDHLAYDCDNTVEYLYTTCGGNGNYPLTIIIDPHGEIFHVSHQIEFDYDTLLILIMSAYRNVYK